MDTDLELILQRAAEQPDDVDARIAAAYALDRAGREEEAVHHYDAAWALGIPEQRRRGFVVGYGSTLRNVGRLEESVAILGNASAADPSYPAFKAFLALSLFSSGERAAALATMLDALLDAAGGASLDGYERALVEYQQELLDEAVAGSR
ncbi:MAG TPA: tetratricopeptide repeat protein [Kofleriaceae bacterium]|nr:tetratricopeptide repeat protein [Kofleriaceae bacterium]